MADGIASPPRAVWEHRTPDSGAWLCLFGLATYGKFASPERGLHVYPKRATLAVRLGLLDEDGSPKVATIKEQIARLKASNVLEKMPRGWRVQLQWRDWPGDVRPAAAPPAWLLAAPIPAHVKRCTIGLWSFAEYVTDGDAVVYPTLGSLADRTGQRHRTVRSQVREVIAMGLAERVEDGLRLIVDPPLEPPNQPSSPPPPVTAEPPHVPSRPPQPAITAARNQPSQPPHNLQGTCSDLALNLGASSADHAQRSLFGSEAEPDRIPSQPEKTPRRDLVPEVIDYFNAQVTALRSWADMPAAKGVTMTGSRRKEIEARMLDIDDTDEERLAAARRVIDVQVYQVKSNGKASTSKGFKRDFKMLRTSTLFRDGNFTKWLDRWSDDGEHELWWQSERNEPKPMHRSVGVNDRHREIAEQAKNGDPVARAWNWPGESR